MHIFRAFMEPMKFFYILKTFLIFKDILYCRRTTKGIEEFSLEIENVPFLFVDVGGQRTQRQKWFQCFDNVTAILFLASSSEFNQVMEVNFLIFI